MADLFFCSNAYQAHDNELEETVSEYTRLLVTNFPVDADGEHRPSQL